MNPAVELPKRAQITQVYHTLRKLAISAPWTVRKAVLVALLALLLGSRASAQVPSRPDTSAMRSMLQQGFSAMRASEVEAMLSRMQISLQFLSDPHTTELLATFTKQYFDALVSKGFTKEEALQIVIHTENSSLSPLR